MVLKIQCYLISHGNPYTDQLKMDFAKDLFDWNVFIMVKIYFSVAKPQIMFSILFFFILKNKRISFHTYLGVTSHESPPPHKNPTQGAMVFQACYLWLLFYASLILETGLFMHSETVLHTRFTVFCEYFCKTKYCLL